MSTLKIGIFNVYPDSLYEEREVDKVNLKGITVKVEVNTKDEGDFLPHFHVSSKDNSINCCIRIYQSGYFLHGIHNKPLPTNSLKELNKWLRQPNLARQTMTNWEVIDYIWTKSFGDSKKFTDSPPDYSKINNNIIDTKVVALVDLGLTEKCQDKFPNYDIIKIGRDRDNTSNYCVVIRCDKENTKEVSTKLKHIWYNIYTGTCIYICTMKNSNDKIKLKDTESLMKQLVLLGIFDSKDIDDYTYLDTSKFKK